MHFTKLRLSGFKSFVEPTDLYIAPGLTGVVGPNGCGKSNLFEALRWVMGETSAKQMRGGEMDNVIFGGTATRPARNVAEVVIHLDNSDRTAPAAFNDYDDIEISRRIEREKGSVYRINGREVRARDVQILFADQATGPRSTALVSQGRIGAIIGAKPKDRRGLLEEAAGISGLHSRRHEAELRLRAAETNLERLDDVIVTLDEQLQGLKKQARQARRYRNISDHIRQTEAAVLHHRWTTAQADVEAAKTTFVTAENTVAELTRRVATATTQRENTAQALSPLRQAEVELAAEVQRLTLANASLDAEEERVATQQRQAATHKTQIAEDLRRESVLDEDAATALRQLAATQLELQDAGTTDAETTKETQQNLQQAAAAANAIEQEHTQLTEIVASGEARKTALEREITSLRGRADSLGQRFTQVSDDYRRLDGEAKDRTALQAAQAAVAAAEIALTAAREKFDTAEHTRAGAQQAADAAQEQRHTAAEQRARVRAEIAALTDMLASTAPGDWQPVLDSVQVDPGYETALGAALGEDLDAATSDTAPKHWRTLPATPGQALPAQAEPLGRFVRGAAALSRRLAHIGVVKDARDGEQLAPNLALGQRLVSLAGDLWRWDGYTVKAGASSAAAVRLEQRNRLNKLAASLKTAEARFAETEAALNSAQGNTRQTGDNERDARQAQRQAESALHDARETHASLARKAATATDRIAGLQESAARLEQELGEVTGRLTAALEDIASFDDLTAQREQVVAARQRLSESRGSQAQAQAAVDQLARDIQDRQRRLAAIAQDRDSWAQRQQNAKARVIELQQRDAALTAELAGLATRPGEIEQQRHTLLDSLSRAQTRRTDAADRVALGETAATEADRTLKSAEVTLAQAREQRVRVEAHVAQTEQTRATVRERITERLECRPEEVLAIGGFADAAALPEQEASERKLERLLRERDGMGPVNLRAEQEAEELDEQITTMQSERTDLLAAIARLRQAIASLNRQARQRLMTSFTEVDRHFQELFVRLFGGGRAHLELTEADDPLDAGLEIFASPPGKVLQSLSLLSGGEQALTAVALLFAVFQTNPAPICVLDEVDAPLDDANVDRFCNLLQDIAADGDTRFLIVTHHRMTMARMDRLFGVTMPERGISQLVSVDLLGATQIRRTA
ncbi:MAG: chromosome segregation protein SMC [Alphaproteobacteria bacterium]